MASWSVTGVSGLSLRKYRTAAQRARQTPGWGGADTSGFSAMSSWFTLLPYQPPAPVVRLLPSAGLLACL